MTRHIARFLPALLLGMVAQAATISFTLTVTNATVTISGSTASLSGPAILSLGGGAPDSGTFNSSGSLADINGSNITVPFTLKFADGTVTGTMTFPASALITAGPAGGGSASITGGTGIYAGYTGSSTAATGSSSASLLGNQTISFTISGTITTSGSTGGGNTPTITAVLDAGSYTANIAEGSIFVVKGTNLSGSGYNSLGFPLPTSSGGVSITFTPVSGGAGTNAYLVYTYNESGVNQLAAILPSTLAAGNYNVTVTNGTATSAPFAATVVKSKVGIFTQDSSGTGLAVMQNYVSASEIDIDRFTTGTVSGVTISPAKPGQVLIAWGTGMGPVSFADNTGSPGYDFTQHGVNVQAIVGGVSIPAAYRRAHGDTGRRRRNRFHPSREYPHRLHHPLPGFGERSCERAHLYLDRSERQSGGLRAAGLHHRPIDEFRPGRNHDRGRVQPDPDSGIGAVIRKCENRFGRRVLLSVHRLPVGRGSAVQRHHLHFGRLPSDQCQRQLGVLWGAAASRAWTPARCP